MADTEGAAQQEIEKQGIHLPWAGAYATLYLYATWSAKVCYVTNEPLV